VAEEETFQQQRQLLTDWNLLRLGQSCVCPVLCLLFSFIYRDLRLAGFCDIVSSILLEFENPP
jgi:hypothetical protein